MRKALRTTLVSLVAVLLAPCAYGGAIWSIYWTTPKLDCTPAGAPIVSPYYQACLAAGKPVSICPGYDPIRSFMPYNAGQPITIIGYELTQVLSDPTASGYLIVGSWHVRGRHTLDGADVFGSTGGVGTNSKSAIFPRGSGIPQGQTPGNHIDFYGACDKGTMKVIAVLLYTSP